MPITKTYFPHTYYTAAAEASRELRAPEAHFAGRVIEVKKFLADRNHSDTMDYSDWRRTECTYALVWLGTRNVPAVGLDGDMPIALLENSAWGIQRDTRDLEFHEQFAWIDCTNICSDRNGYRVDPVVDADPAHYVGEPEMWMNLIAWRSYQAALEAKRVAAAEKAAAVAAKAEADRAKRAAAKTAKLAAAEAEARAMLAHIPARGTTVTVDGFTGKVFWTGVSKYYGKWNARAGVKDAKGEVRWIDASHWAK